MKALGAIDNLKKEVGDLSKKIEDNQLKFNKEPLVANNNNPQNVVDILVYQNGEQKFHLKLK